MTIQADRTSLKWLADRLRQALIDPTTVPLSEPTDADDGVALAQLHLKPGAGPVQISVEGRALLVQGGAEQRSTLAANLSWFADNGDAADPGEHMHEEHYDTPGWEHHLAVDAEPLVITFPR